METMQMVGLREFRANLHKYARRSQEPITVTSHGEAVGYYIPARPGPQRRDLEALQAASRKLAALLAEEGTSEDELVAEFQAARQSPPQS